MADTMEYVIIGALVLAAIVATILVRRKRAADKLRQTITAQWGKAPVEKYKNEDMQSISSYYTNLAAVRKNVRFIDDITWNDLDMDGIFKRVNSTQSTVGEEYLYYLLREPVYEESELKERTRLIEYFRANPDEREKLQFILARLGRKRFTGISEYFLSNERNIPLKGLRYIILSAALVLSPLVMIFSFALGLFLMVALFITNVTVYYQAKNELTAYLEGLSYIVNLIGFSKKAADAGITGIEEYARTLRESTKRIKGFSIKSFYLLFYQTQDPFLEYIKVVLLGELIAFESLLKKVYKHKDEIRILYETIGMLDSMLSIASYRESLDYYVTPALFKSSGTHPKALCFKEAFHPLIKDPVVNSLELSRPALVTGSNASGKSTFLKTAAINAIFAQTIHTCLAREYTSCFFMVFTSMALKDNLSSNESYYIAEIKSLKRIFDSLNDAVPLLCMIDEVLRGTNTVERIAASSEVLHRLSKSNCVCIAATHDIELASMLKQQYGNYHFQESFEGNEIIFDYKIYPGKSTTRNAIKLLRIMGYTDDMVHAAEERAERFTQEGKWQDIEE